MFFRKKPKSLAYAIDLVHEAMSIAWAYQYNKDYQPTEESATRIRELEGTLWLGFVRLSHLRGVLENRLYGKDQLPPAPPAFHLDIAEIYEGLEAEGAGD